MITVTRLNGIAVVLNAELIEHIESTPDTLITLTTGNKVNVLEPVDEVVRRVIEYQRACHTFAAPGAQDDESAPPRAGEAR
jgi:flagellar protein FlbD